MDVDWQSIYRNLKVKIQRSFWLIAITIGLLLFYVIPHKGVDYVLFELMSIFLSLSVFNAIKKFLNNLQESGDVQNSLRQTWDVVKSDLLTVGLGLLLMYVYIIPQEGMSWFYIKITMILASITLFNIVKKFFDELEDEMKVEEEVDNIGSQL